MLALLFEVIVKDLRIFNPIEILVAQSAHILGMVEGVKGLLSYLFLDVMNLLLPDLFPEVFVGLPYTVHCV